MSLEAFVLSALITVGLHVEMVTAANIFIHLLSPRYLIERLSNINIIQCNKFSFILTKI